MFQKQVQSRLKHQFIRWDAGTLLLDFPGCTELKVTEALLQKLTYSRKTEAYRPAHNIARLLLLNYHPDVRRGIADVLALMFDMNARWEKYILKSLRRKLQEEAPGEYLLREQVHTDFWQPELGYMRIIKPDIVVYQSGHPQKALLVIDTKWKRLTDNRPSDDDLKQMLVYTLFQGCSNSTLLYKSLQGRKRYLSYLWIDNEKQLQASA